MYEVLLDGKQYKVLSMAAGDKVHTMVAGEAFTTHDVEVCCSMLCRIVAVCYANPARLHTWTTAGSTTRRSSNGRRRMLARPGSPALRLGRAGCWRCGLLPPQFMLCINAGSAAIIKHGVQHPLMSTQPPAPRERRLLFIGDSITAGYGVLCNDSSGPFAPETESAWHAYAAVATRALDADAHVIAYSGKGEGR